MNPVSLSMVHGTDLGEQTLNILDVNIVFYGPRRVVTNAPGDPRLCMLLLVVSRVSTGSLLCLLSVHRLSLVVLSPNEIIQDQGCTDSEQKDENEETNPVHHPRKMSTMSLAPEVVSRYNSE